jgi:integrase/recombinase XerD
MDRKELKRILVRETNVNKYTYQQLKDIFKEVRKSCDLQPDKSTKKVYDLPTTQELQNFYEGMSNVQHRLIFKTLESTGLRVSELCNLEIRRVDFPNNTIHVHKGKGGKDRIVPIGNKLKDLLTVYLSGRNNRYLFETTRHYKFSTRRIEQLCQKYKDLANVDKDFTPHTFRHIYFTRLAEYQVSKEYRAMLAGHSNETMQDIYTHIGLGGIKNQIIEIIDGF